MASLLLLIEDVDHLGRSGDVVKVKAGFARNYILPRGLGVKADKNALRMQEKLKEERKAKAIADKTDAEAQAKALEEVTLTATVKVDQEGHMYGSVSVADIVHLLEKEQKFQITKQAVMLKHPIKVVGMHRIELKLKEGVIASFNLNVIPEESKEA